MKTIKEMIEVMQAAAEGKTIEWKPEDPNFDNVGWREGKMGWNWIDCDYRVKPEPKYRPWKTVDEVPVGKIVCEITKPSKHIIICCVCDERVPGGLLITIGGLSSGNSVLVYRLLKDFVMEDGTPCGVKEE